MLDAFIQSELRKRNISFRLVGKEIVILCPFHNDSRPSLNISRDKGVWLCRACPAKGSWNKLAKAMDMGGVEGLPEIDPFDILDNNLKDTFLPEDSPSLPPGLLPWKGEWRGLSQDFLQSFPSYDWYDDRSHCQRILFPILMREQLYGYVARRTDGNDEPRYRNSDKLPAKKILFGIDKIRSRTVLLVEGPFSALKPLSIGIPAVAILGARQWSPVKASLLLSKGVENIVLAMDNDKTGNEAALELEAQLKDDFSIFKIETPEKDLGECSDSYLQWLKQTVESI